MDEPLTISISLSLRIIALFYCLIQPVLYMVPIIPGNVIPIPGIGMI